MRDSVGYCEQAQGIVARRHAVAERRLGQAGGQSVPGQYRRRHTGHAHHIQGAAMQHAPPCIPRLGIDHVADLIVREAVANDRRPLDGGSQPTGHDGPIPRHFIAGCTDELARQQFVERR